jgi:hypothetical protein
LVSHDSIFIDMTARGTRNIRTTWLSVALPRLVTQTVPGTGSQKPDLVQRVQIARGLDQRRQK